MRKLLSLLGFLALFTTARADDKAPLANIGDAADGAGSPQNSPIGEASVEANGLYYLSSLQSAPEVRTVGGSPIRVGQKASIKIQHAHVYSENNANTAFGVRLDTSEYPVDPKTKYISNPVTLRVGEHWYAYNGGAGKGYTGGPFNVMWFNIQGQEAAEAAAKWLSVECTLRSPPGYKLYPQFVPANADYATNEPVIVKFKLKNLDDRTVIFQRGGQQRGSRDNQYGFRAMLYGVRAKSGVEPVPDVGNPLNFGGIGSHVELKPDQVFEDQIDLKKWFAFDKPGRYAIHGFYGLAFYRPAAREDSYMPWSVLWQDYASADFVAEVK